MSEVDINKFKFIIIIIINYNIKYNYKNNYKNQQLINMFYKN